ncbi:hypothetical protein SpCBS45565_g03723 [Spizellomyces sp. 'palustris']|nr:hypothetical protein SpCBS45565_g03723 [Spizellomyces sp. 'palustris']
MPSFGRHQPDKFFDRQHESEYNYIPFGPEGTITPITITSDVFASLFMKSVSQCLRQQIPQACQALANLCVLQLYDFSTAPCQVYQSIIRGQSSVVDTLDAPQGLPWLYYGLLSSQESTTFTSQVLNLTVDIGSGTGVSRLPFVMSTYSLNGTYLGLQKLTTQLQLCTPVPSERADDWRQIGYDYVASCTIDLASAINSTSTATFYDLFIEDSLGILKAVPIRVINYRTLAGRQPNLNADPLDYSSSVLFRRFFSVDDISGVQGGLLKVVRVPLAITVWIRKADSDGRIYIPVLDVAYTERDVSTLSEQTSISLQFAFSALYIMHLDNFWRVMTVVFSLVCATAGLLALYSARAWSTRNLTVSQGWDFNFLSRCILILAGCLAPLLFWFLLAVSAYWFFFYKNQTVMKVLLPWSDSDLHKFNAIVITTLICQGAYIIKQVYEQCTVDIFFIDWERSRGKVMAAGGEGKPRLAAVSVWRSIFMMNEWNKMQTYRRVNIEFSLLALYFIVEGLKVRYAATPQPNIHDLTPGLVNPILLFAVECLLWILLAVAQILFRAVIYERFYKDKLLDFVDVLSMANLSILAFDELCHGYYIHGRSVHPCADTNIGELNAFLRREQADLVPRRGMQDTDQQCFEVFTQKEMRSAFNKVYSMVIAEVEAQTVGNVAARLQRLSADKMQRRFNGADETRVRAYETVNHFARSFFDKNLKEFQYHIRERTYFERFLGTTPDVSQNTVLFHTPSSFTRLLLYGIEYHLLILYILIFTVADNGLGNTGAAAIITYGVDVVIRVIRKHFGASNLARKTMMDRKFLI